MKRLGHGAQALQRAADQAAQLAQFGRGRKRRVLKSRVMSARQDPGLVRHAGGVRAEGEIVSANFDNPLAPPHLLGQDVAEDATLLLLEVVEPGAQLIEHPAGDEGGRGKFRVGVLELLSRAGAVILEHADVAEAGIALEVLDALRREQQKLLNLAVIGLPEWPVVARVLYQHFVRA